MGASYRCGVRDTRRGVYGRLSSVSVSEKGAGLSGPLVEDHYELELPWLPWLRTDPEAESARGNPDAKRSPKYRVFDFTTDSIHPRLLCLCYPSLSSSFFSLWHCARSVV